MKRCPRCTADYYDEIIEFCLEDGAKLFTVSRTLTQEPTANVPFVPNHFSGETLHPPFASETKTIESVGSGAAQNTPQTDFNNTEKSSATSRIVEVAPVVFALAHNWWQWLYVTNQSYSSVTGFLMSGNFLMWLILLTFGSGLGLLAVKRCQNKGYAFVGLVVLSINLILFLVPRR